MRHISWFTLIALCFFAMKGIRRNSPDMHARDLVQISENKTRGFHLENQTFDNNEMQNISTLKKAIDQSAGRQ